MRNSAVALPLILNSTVSTLAWPFPLEMPLCRSTLGWKSAFSEPSWKQHFCMKSLIWSQGTKGFPWNRIMLGDRGLRGYAKSSVKTFWENSGMNFHLVVNSSPVILPVFRSLNVIPIS